MSLDISLCNKDDDSDYVSMNWLRNPFGLERWAEDNFKYATKDFAIPVTLSASLWDVCNKWSYDDSEHVDRALFKHVVDVYNIEIKQLKVGYFWFDIYSLMQFVVPDYSRFPKDPRWNRILGSHFHEDKLGIPQEYFGRVCGGEKYCALSYYKKWFGELVEFAELLQDPAYVFYCSN